MLGAYLLDHAAQDWRGPGGLFAGRRQLPAGNLLVWMRVCVLEELLTDLAWSESLASYCYPIVKFRGGTAPWRDPDGSANASQRWTPTGPPQLNQVGRD